jgi:hypothetical protein
MFPGLQVLIQRLLFQCFMLHCPWWTSIADTNLLLPLQTHYFKSNSKHCSQHFVTYSPTEIVSIYKIRTFYPVALRTNARQGLLILEVFRSHSDTPQSARPLWTSDQLVAETSTWQYITFTRNRRPCPRRDLNPQSLQGSSSRPMS